MSELNISDIENLVLCRGEIRHVRMNMKDHVAIMILNDCIRVCDGKI